jgi:hypothetical protein
VYERDCVLKAGKTCTCVRCQTRIDENEFRAHDLRLGRTERLTGCSHARHIPPNGGRYVTKDWGEKMAVRDVSPLATGEAKSYRQLDPEHGDAA